jgi:hypothetical protein
MSNGPDARSWHAMGRGEHRAAPMRGLIYASTRLGSCDRAPIICGFAPGSAWRAETANRFAAA